MLVMRNRLKMKEHQKQIVLMMYTQLQQNQEMLTHMDLKFQSLALQTKLRTKYKLKIL
jgi:hypothetical protein